MNKFCSFVIMRNDMIIKKFFGKIIDIYKYSSTYMHPVIFGTFIWIIVGLVVGWRVLLHIKNSSPAGK